LGWATDGSFYFYFNMEPWLKWIELVCGVRFITEDNYFVLDGGVQIRLLKVRPAHGGWVLDLENFWLSFCLRQHDERFVGMGFAIYYTVWSS